MSLSKSSQSLGLNEYWGRGLIRLECCIFCRDVVGFCKDHMDIGVQGFSLPKPLNP